MENNTYNKDILLYSESNLKKMGKVNSWLGVFYLLEYDNYIKIGCTKNPYQRYKQLVRNAKNYNNTNIGRFFISPWHTNYCDNEKILHKHFEKYRKPDTELFDITIEDFLSQMPIIKYEDDSEEKDKKVESAAIGMFKYFHPELANMIDEGELIL